jgi:hypothetical protein
MEELHQEPVLANSAQASTNMRDAKDRIAEDFFVHLCVSNDAST